jgi:hypothetical protein
MSKHALDKIASRSCFSCAPSDQFAETREDTSLFVSARRRAIAMADQLNSQTKAPATLRNIFPHRENAEAMKIFLCDDK